MWTRAFLRCCIAAAVLCTGHRAAAEELVLWHAYRGQEKRVLEQLVADYDAAHPDVEVVSRAVPYDGFVTKLEAAAPRGNGPDLFIAAHERVGSWAASGLVEPVDIPREELEGWLHPVAWKSK